jgi:hypothetical protein
VSENPSQIFGRAFFDPPEREGLSEIDPDADEDVRRTRRELWNEINAFLQDAQAHLLVHGQPPRLYFDFIRADTFNASSRFYSEIYFIGLHDVAVARISNLAGAIALKAALYQALGIMDIVEPGSASPDSWVPPADLIEAQKLSLTQYIAMFAVGHELGHHVHGHTTTDFTSKSPMERQAAEIEADAYSACLTLQSLLKGAYKPIRDRSVARLMFLAAAAYIDCAANPAFDWKQLKTQHYPPYSIRLEYLQGAIQAIWRRLRPDCEEALALSSVDQLLNVAHGVWGREEKSLTLIRQSEGLDEDVLDRYTGELAIVRKRLREELFNDKWKAIEKDPTPLGSVDNDGQKGH